jgi:hypothetical protein
MEQSSPLPWGRYGAMALAVLVAGYAFVLRSPVPLLDLVDLGVHELGHLIVGDPPMAHFLAGSVAQVLVPAALAAYFLAVRRDRGGGGFCLAWAGASAWDVSVYIADAPRQALPLIGGGVHDWAYLLGPNGWDALESAGVIARGVDLAGLVVSVAGVGIAIAAVVAWHLSPPAAPGRVPPACGEDDPWVAAARLPFFADSRRSGRHRHSNPGQPGPEPDGWAPDPGP